MKLHDFAKEKLVNFILFTTDTFGEDMVDGAMSKVAPMPAISVLVMLDQLKPCAAAIHQKNLMMICEQFTLFDIQQLLPVFDTISAQQQDKFWRYMECFMDCITNSK